MPENMTPREVADESWYWYLIGENKLGFPKSLIRQLKTSQRIFDLLPAGRRCLQCHMPLTGLGSAVLRLLDLRASMLTPKLCNRCEKMILSHEGGAEVELSLLFADMRGSTRLSEQKGTTEYFRLMQRFYKTAAQAIIERNGMVNRLIGDQVIGMFVPRFSGPEHPAVAIDAALEILRMTGHADPEGPWAPIGIGVHCGTVYVGAVGSKEGLNEIAVLGNAANLAARLSSNAAEGELLVSEEAAAIAQQSSSRLEKRRLTLKGISQPVTATVIKLNSE